MKLVTEECAGLGLRAGAIIFRNLRIADAGPELRQEIAAEVRAVQAQFPDAAAIRSTPHVAAFHDLLRRVGVNPRRVQPSVERLLNFAVKRGDLPAINNLVDAYNVVSVRTGCSLGAHDLGCITLPVSLRLLAGAERFTPLGSNHEEAVAAGEFGYVDGAGRVMCRLDVIQADFSKVTPDTRDAFLIIEGTVAHSADTLRQAFVESVDRIIRHCGGVAEVVAPVA